MVEKTKKRLGELLIEDGILTRENLQAALDHQKKEGGLIGQILVRLGFVTEENLIAALGRQLDIPYIPLANYAVNTQSVHMLEEKFSRAHGLIAFDADERHVFVSMADPLDLAGIAEVEKVLKLKPQVFISTPTEIINMLDMIYSVPKPTVSAKKAG